MIQLTKLKPRGDYAYEEGIQMVWTAWTRPRCCFNSDFCRTKGSGIHFVVLVVGIKSNLAYILIFRRYFFRYLGRRADCQREMVISSLFNHYRYSYEEM